MTSFFQTQLSGVINTDPTLILAESPYVIPFSPEIPRGVTLTIESGIEPPMMTVIQVSLSFQKRSSTNIYM